MDVSNVFSRIRNTLTSTVNEISAVLPGNPLLREYDADIQIGSAGPGLSWKIFNGYKKSTKAEVAIWVLEKKSFDEYSKADRDLIFDSFRKGCLQLTKLRHPRILIVEHSLEESRESLCFCTEPVFASLANVLGQRLNLSKPSKELENYNIHEIEIKYGLMQLSEALSFLHESAKMVHGNLCPESVIINKGGSWKMAGFDFCIGNSGSATDVRFQCNDWDPSLPPVCLPNPNYVAPEYILRKSCDTASDLFSLGVLLYSIYYKGKTFLQNSSNNLYKNMSHSISKLEHINNQVLDRIPSEVVEHEKMLLNLDSNVRPDAEQMSKLPFFNHVGVMTLQYLDTLLQRDNLQKSQFFKGLPKTLEQLPKRVLMQRVLPALTSEFSNPDMIPFVLPSILTIAEDCSKEDFVTFVFPPLIPVFKIQKPVQIYLILLQKMDLILLKTPSPMVQNHVLPMLSSALTSSSVQIQELCMSIIPSFSEHLDNQSLKSSVLPKLRQIAISGSTIAIRIHALVCIGKLVNHFDKWYVQDEVLPFLENIPSKEPGILMSILGIYQTVLISDRLGISKQVMATRALPFLIPLSIESTLNFKQYSAFMDVIKDMMKRVETEHRAKLEQLGKMKLEEAACLDFQKDEKSNISASNISNGLPTTKTSIDDFFNKTTEPTKPATRQNLTLEEKQRLAKMKEQEYRMKKDGEIKPTFVREPPKSNPVPLNQPKDLTSTLMLNNLQAMSFKNSNQSFSSSTALGRMQGSVGPQFGIQANQWSSMPAANVAKPVFPASQPTFPLYSAQPISTSIAPQSLATNTSAFDNLLNMPSQRKSIPMNQMKSPSMVSSSNNSRTGQHRPVMGQNPFLNPKSSSSTFVKNNQATNSRSSNDNLLDFLG